MADRTIVLLSSVVTKLKTDLSAYVDDRVYLQPPKDPTFPYVKVSLQVEPYNTFTTADQQHNVRVQVFSQRNKAAAECVTIRGLVYDALNRIDNALILTSGSVVSFEHTGFADAFVEGDGKTWQAVIEFTAITK